MRGLDDYYGDDSDAFAGVEELNERIAELEAENERLRGKIQAARDVCTASRDLIKWTNTRTAGVYMPAVPINDILAALDGDA